MRRYITIWLVIILVVDLLTFGFLVSTGGDFIKCNKGVPDGAVYDASTGSYYVEVDFDIEHGGFTIPEPEEESVVIYFVEILVIISIVLAGTAFFLYLVLASAKRKKYVLTIISSLALAAFLIATGYWGFRHYRYLTSVPEPKKIVYLG